jgi:four helix bundle protein
MKKMSHEKLDVYRKSIEFLSIAASMQDSFPRGQSALADQLKRASMSIPLNIAEATGKTGKADNRKFFAIARGSTLECAAIMDVCLTLKISNQECLGKAKNLLFEITAMLSSLCR